MVVKDYIVTDFPRVSPWTGVVSIEEQLLEKTFLVVFDQEEYYGILTPNDLIKKPHRLVADCISPLTHLAPNCSPQEAYTAMVKLRTHVLPVFDEGQFCGIVNAHHMLGSLAMKSFTITREMDQLKKDLSEASGKANMNVKLKEAFLKNVYHEIRTPLNGLLGFSEVISSASLSDFERREFLDHIIRSSEQFLDVIDKLVLYSKIQTGDLIPGLFEVASVEELLSNLNDFAGRYSDRLDRGHRNISIRPQIQTGIMVRANLTHLKRILKEIVENALKHTPCGAEISISHQLLSNRHIFNISDGGPGIPENEIKTIFEPFEKYIQPGKDFTPGPGLGLAIVQQLCQYNQWDFHFDSSSDKGTSVAISLPAE